MSYSPAYIKRKKKKKPKELKIVDNCIRTEIQSTMAAKFNMDYGGWRIPVQAKKEYMGLS